MLLAVGGHAAEVVQPNIEVRPSTLTGTGTVDVSINIFNSGDDPAPLSVTLYDPANNVCTGFGSGGTARLSPGQSASYTGKWTVTSDQLEKGRVTYSVRYSTVNGEGQPVANSRPFYATIKHNAAKATMKIERDLPKELSVTENQTVSIGYTLINTGTVDILDIAISDPGINNDVLTYPLLPVGEKVVLSTSYVAGTSPKTAEATIAYKYVLGDKKEEAKVNMDPKVIKVTVRDLAVDLKASQLIVNAGQKVDLTCTITNRSELTYAQLKVTDKIINDVEQGISLGAGKTHTITKSVTILQSGTYQFTVSGIDSTGQPVTFTSNEVTVQTTEDMQTVDGVIAEVIPVVLEVLIEADRDIIYSEPSEIIFRVKITNNGLSTVENIEVTALKTKVETIERLAPGETYEFLKRFNASMGGQYQFVASAKDNTGETRSAESNVYLVTFQPTRPPATPPPTPVPTQPPTEPPSDLIEEQAVTQSDGGGITTGKLLLYILAGLLVVIVLAVVLLFILDHRRYNPKPPSGYGNGQNAVIDSIQRSPHRDYARPPKRGKPGAEKNVKKKQEQPVMPAYAPDDEEEEMFRPRESGRDAAPKRVFGADGSASGALDDSVYRRPTGKRTGESRDDRIEEEDSGEKGVREAGIQAEKPEAPQRDRLTSMDQTEVYGREYLSRIRQTPARDKEDETGKAPPLSEEEASLLSGSTGQYRLSRRTGSVRRPMEKTDAREGAKEPVRRKAEDPEEYTRKQRAARGNQGSVANFYDDDDEDGNGKEQASRRRNPK